MPKAKLDKSSIRKQRQTRTYQVIFVIISILVIVTFILQLVK